MQPPSEDPRPEPRVLFEDSSLVAILKPPRMHSAPGLGPGDLCAWAFERYPEARGAGGGRAGGKRSPAEGGLLHRLDYETSGIVLFARDHAAFGSLLDQQERGLFRKEYLAVSAVSRESRPEGSVPAKGIPAGVDEGAWAEARESLDAAALAALIDGAAGSREAYVACAFRPFGPRASRVACLGPGEGRGRGGAVYRSDFLSCIEASPGLGIRLVLSRGFRHQVRAQLAWLGLPVSGDPLYGGAPDDRLRLYATALSFAHPASGEPTRLASDPNSDGLVAFAAHPI